jgi:hypothetical protein
MVSRASLTQPARPGPCRAVSRVDAGAGRLNDCSAGCGGGKAAAAALLCVASVRVRPAWGPPGCRCSAGGRAAGEARRGGGPGVAAAPQGPGLGAAEGLGRAPSVLPGTPARGRLLGRSGFVRDDPASRSGPLRVTSRVPGGWGWGACRPVISVFRGPTSPPRPTRSANPVALRRCLVVRPPFLGRKQRSAMSRGGGASGSQVMAPKGMEGSARGTARGWGWRPDVDVHTLGRASWESVRQVKTQAQGFWVLVFFFFFFFKAYRLLYVSVGSS